MTQSWARANFMWIGPKLSPIEILALKSYLATGWVVTVYTYGDVEGIPAGCEVRDGRAILDHSLIFTDQENGAPGVSYANFSDLFRWQLLSRQAGWWFDMDMVSLKAPKPIPDNVPMRCGSTWEHEWGQCAITAAMYSNGQCDLFAEAFHRGMALLGKGEERTFTALGPHMLQTLVQENAFERHVAPWWEFCPFPWRQINTACSQTTREHFTNQLRVLKHILQARTGALVRPARVRVDTQAVHLHNEIWRRGGLSKTGPFSRYSFVGRQLLKHDVPGAIVV